MFTQLETENRRILLTSVELSNYTNPEGKIIADQIPQSIRRKLCDVPSRTTAVQIQAAKQNNAYKDFRVCN